jgi:hypothetical protein
MSGVTSGLGKGGDCAWGNAPFGTSLVILPQNTCRVPEAGGDIRLIVADEHGKAFKAVIVPRMTFATSTRVASWSVRVLTNQRSVAHSAVVVGGVGVGVCVRAGGEPQRPPIRRQ